MKKRITVTAKGALLSVIVTTMLALLLASLVSFGDIPDSAVIALIFFILALSCITGAYAAAKTLSSKGLLTGAALGIIYYIVLAIISLILTKSFSFNSHMLIMLISAMLAGMLGGVLGMPR